MTAKVLIVEDNELNLKLFTDLLRAHSYEVTPLREGRDTLVTAQACRPDLVVMDIQLGEVSGLDCIAELRGDPTLAAIPVLAVTAYAGKGDEDRILSAGAQRYVSKPVSVMAFLEAVKQTLATR